MSVILIYKVIGQQKTYAGVLATTQFSNFGLTFCGKWKTT